MKLYKIIKKNFTVLLRSKSSAFVVLIGPLIIIALISLAFSNSQEYSITVGITAPDKEGLTNQFITQLNKSAYTIIYYSTAGECVEQIKLQNTNICILFPEKFILSNEQVKEVVFYADQSRINLVESIVSSVSSTIYLKSDEISLALTKNLLDTINVASEELAKEKKLVDEIKSKSFSISKEVDTVTAKSEFITQNLTSAGKNNKEINASIRQLYNETTNLLEDLYDMLESIKGLEIKPSGTSRVRVHYNKMNELLPVEVTNINNSVIELKEAVRAMTTDIGDTHTGIIGAAERAEAALKSINSSIQSIKDSFKVTEEKINQIQITSASNIVNPFTIKVNPIVSVSDRSVFMFPYFITLIVLFVGIMLSSSLVVMEKRSSAFFRTFTTPTSELYHIIAEYTTNLIVLVFQLTIVFVGAYYYLNIPLFNNFTVTVLSLFLSLSFFILLGTLIGYMFTTQEGTTIASISLGSLFLFLSNLVLPVESFPNVIRKLIMLNPFMLCSELFKKSMLFSASFSSLSNGILILVGYIIMACVLVIIFQRVSFNRFFSELAYRKVLLKPHITNENCFRLQDGTLLKTLADLRHSLKDMNEEEFKRYVNKHNNEIALWVKEAFKEKSLARKIKKAGTKERIIRVFEEQAEQTQPQDLAMEKQEEKIKAGAISSKGSSSFLTQKKEIRINFRKMFDFSKLKKIGNIKKIRIRFVK